MKKKPEQKTWPPPQAEQERVFRLIRKWQNEFYLQIMQFDVVFLPEPDDDDGTFDGRCCASIDASIADFYHRAKIKVFPPFFEDPVWQQEFSIAHEMAHILTEPLTALLERAQTGELVTAAETTRVEERVTDWIARVCVFGGSAPQVTRPSVRKPR